MLQNGASIGQFSVQSLVLIYLKDREREGKGRGGKQKRRVESTYACIHLFPLKWQQRLRLGQAEGRTEGTQSRSHTSVAGTQVLESSPQLPRVWITRKLGRDSN